MKKRLQMKVVEPSVVGVPFDELAPHHCRYPITAAPPHRFCGAERMLGCSYCPSCMAITHNGYPKPQTVPARRAA